MMTTSKKAPDMITIFHDHVEQTCNPELSKEERIDCAMLGLGGEAGEVLELWKKHRYHGQPVSRENLLEELGDLLWYVTLIVDANNATLEDVMMVNVEKLAKRYPYGFVKKET